MTVKISLKNFESIGNAFTELKRRMRSSETTEPAGEFTTEMVVKRTRSGLGVPSTGAGKEPLENLSDKYVKWRKAHASQLSEFTKSGQKKSNLTLTGQMLDNLESKPISGGFKITIEGERSNGVSNSTIAGYHHAKNARGIKRPFMFLAGIEITKLQDFIRDLARDIISSLLKK